MLISIYLQFTWQNVRCSVAIDPGVCMEISIDCINNMERCEMFSYKISRHVHINFHRSSSNMAECEMFSFTRSRLVYMEFPIDLLVT